MNGTPYVVGESAERHGLITQRTGTARYTEDYFGVLAAISLSKLYGRGREVAVFASHPPGDVKYRQDLMESIIGEWEIETGHSKANFRVIYVNTFDEPVGGLMNVLLAKDGQHYQYQQIGDGRSLVVDIGGFTTDFLAVNQGGEVDYSLARSVPLGIQSVINDFEESFRANNLEVVKNTPVLPPERVRCQRQLDLPRILHHIIILPLLHIFKLRFWVPFLLEYQIHSLVLNARILPGAARYVIDQQ